MSVKERTSLYLAVATIALLINVLVRDMTAAHYYGSESLPSSPRPNEYTMDSPATFLRSPLASESVTNLPAGRVLAATPPMTISTDTDTDRSITKPATSTVNTNTNTNYNSGLPTCKSLMQSPQSPYKDGSFLTRPAIPVVWRPRADGSRELTHSLCTLHRYTATEATQCLANKHVNMMGDSLTRYQYLSLARFLHKGSYPPRFGRPFPKNKPCLHRDEAGQPTCSPRDEPNICMEGDWAKTRSEPWLGLMRALGSELFDGHMEANAVRTMDLTVEQMVENYLYVSPPLQRLSPEQQQQPNNQTARTTEKDTTTTAGKNHNKVILSYIGEIGEHDSPLPIKGFHWTGCAFDGTCKYTDAMAQDRIQRAKNMSFDYMHPLVEALSPGSAADKDQSVLQQLLPPVNITLYNRGLWGTLSEARAKQILPRLHKFSQGKQGRCYFRSTTSKPATQEVERSYVREAAFHAGCGFLDFGHLVEDFNHLPFQFPPPPGQEYGSLMHERSFIFWDIYHFMPWVYEELNNMLLNILCNAA